MYYCTQIVFDSVISIEIIPNLAKVRNGKIKESYNTKLLSLTNLSVGVVGRGGQCVNVYYNAKRKNVHKTHAHVPVKFRFI